MAHHLFRVRREFSRAGGHPEDAADAPAVDPVTVRADDDQRLRDREHAVVGTDGERSGMSASYGSRRRGLHRGGQGRAADYGVPVDGPTRDARVPGVLVALWAGDRQPPAVVHSGDAVVAGARVPDQERLAGLGG